MSLRAVNPFDQTTAADLPYDTGATLEQKVEGARKAFDTWRRVPIEERKRRLQAGVARFRAAAEETARDITLQMGKPILQARREVATCCERAEYMISIASGALAPETLPSREDFHLRIEHVPLGVVLDLAAWNYPLLIPVNVVVPALLAGNAVLLKHSARTPLCGVHFEKAFEADLVPGLLTSIILTHEDTAKLIADPRIAHVAFTGSVEGGREVYRHVAGRFIDAGLELGGKDPAYVARDADIDFAVENIVDGACYNAGQSCCAVERVYVHEALHDEFIESAMSLLERYHLGDPLDPATTLGPLASRPALDFLEGQVEDAVRRGGRLLLGGKRLAKTPGNFFLPTLLDGVPNHAKAMQEESFGPILPVLAVRGDDEAIQRMGDSRFGLTASIWTRERERAERIAAELDTGTVYQNRCDFLDPSLPWTGVKDSGKGSTLSRHGFHHLTRRKSIHFRTMT
ncbi:MAG TPA: aldehyde dehydrogenase family protein [Planctomycetota bacterium]|nr:aldehyde dehydrogenase family protein [Planctomycetota bacterium]